MFIRFLAISTNSRMLDRRVSISKQEFQTTFQVTKKDVLNVQVFVF
jgi:hypothetical protein